MCAGIRDTSHSTKYQALRTENRVASRLRSFLLLVGFEMRAQAVDHDVLVSFLHLFFYFFQCEVHHVVMVYFDRPYRFTESQPYPVQEIYFVGGQILPALPTTFSSLVPVSHYNL